MHACMNEGTRVWLQSLVMWRRFLCLHFLSLQCVSAFQSLRKCKGCIHNLQRPVSSSQNPIWTSCSVGWKAYTVYLGLSLCKQSQSEWPGDPSSCLFPHLIGYRGGHESWPPGANEMFVLSYIAGQLSHNCQLTSRWWWCPPPPPDFREH